jgi:hypothetical protein
MPEAIVQSLSQGDVGCSQVSFSLGFVTTEIIRGCMQVTHRPFDAMHGIGDLGVSLLFCSHQANFIGSRRPVTGNDIDADELGLEMREGGGYQKDRQDKDKFFHGFLLKVMNGIW